MSSNRGRGQLECEFTGWFCGELAKVNALTIALVGHEMQVTGLPDRYVCHRGFRGWLEFKRNDRGVTAAQRVVLQGLLDRGDCAMVVRVTPASDFVAVERVPRPGCSEGAELRRGDLRELRAMTAPGTGLLLLLQHAWATYAEELR